MDAILATDKGGTKCEGLLMQIDGQALSFAKISAEREIATRSGKYGYGRSSDAARSMEHPRHVSPLTERVMAEMKGQNGNRKSIYDHVIHEGLRIMSNRTEVASYSRIADQAASTTWPKPLYANHGIDGTIKRTSQSLGFAPCHDTAWAIQCLP